MGMLQSITRLPNGMIGIAANHFDGLSHQHRVGSVPSMSQGQTGTIWDIDDTQYPWSAFDTPGALSVDRSSVSDADKVVLIEGLNPDFDPITEEVTLSAATGNTTSQSFARVKNMRITNGSATNVGDITANLGGTAVAQINAGNGQSLMAIYTVPRGQTGYLLKGVATCEAGADATGAMHVRYGGQSSFVIGHEFQVSGTGGEYSYDFIVPLPIPEKSDIDVRASVRSNNARVTAAFCILLEVD